ncbi:unnamed protein product [Merluccius merluccius]
MCAHASVGVCVFVHVLACVSQPSHDIWEDYGAYGPCSRTCGTGIAMRTRKCITSRTDGGHNCVGSSKSYRICNSQECPIGSRDFREDQCTAFDGLAFQGKHYSWVPYHGASNLCELNCVPRGEDFFYRHRAAVVDGTPCHVGRTDICVDGVCRPLVHGEFLGLDEDARSVGYPARAPVALPPRDTQLYAYTTGVYGVCSATCDGGTQYRRVECVLQDLVNPHAVDETYCIAQRLQRPVCQQACSMHPCAAAEYSVSSFSVCSVTCGEGQQTREVFCTGHSGQRLADHACSSLPHPATVRACRRPACHLHITWHIGDFGLCSRSCGGGVRDRLVGCYDTDLNPYSEDRCESTGRPVTVETCNTQPCSGAQIVPSLQGPRANESTSRGWVPYIPAEHAAPRPPESLTYNHHPAVIGPHCGQSHFGCCTDGHTFATGPRNEGCPGGDCIRTRYGCCMDEMTPAQGFGRAGCSDYQTSVPPPLPATTSTSTGDVCSLPRNEGPCDTWIVRFYYDSGTGKCTEFWYGSCQGNANNFASLEACQRWCGNTLLRETPHTRPTSQGSPRRVATRRAMRARARA